MYFSDLHFQVAEQVKFLNKNSVHIGIGTPNRIKTLIENGKYCFIYIGKLVEDSVETIS